MLPSVRILKDTVQSFPGGATVAPMWGYSERGPILPPFGTKQRDYALRSLARHDFNSIWQGAVAGLTKKIASTPWVIDGEGEYIEYYQNLLQDAHFSQGWSVFVKRLVSDILQQDYGGFIEIIGDGPADEPLDGPVRGIAHLDAGRCYVTGNQTYPVLYYSLWSGALHKMHATRVYRIVDNPSPDERFYGIGSCALSRAIAVVQREIRMGQYVDLTLDDSPPPGLLMVNNVSDKQWESAIQRYGGTLTTDQMDYFGRTMILKNLDPDKTASVESVTFAQPPDKFDFVGYSQFNIDAIANALGIDRQEIAELQGRSLGSGAQSEILAQKARGKTVADIFSSLERFINLVVLPDDLNMAFKAEDPTADQQRAQMLNAYATTAVALVGAGVISTEQAARLLASQSKELASVLINEQGELEATSGQATPTDETPQVDAPKQPAQPQPAAKPVPSQGKPEQQQVTSNETISKALESVEKYNAHHGANGRFTTGEGAVSVRQRGGELVRVGQTSEWHAPVKPKVEEHDEYTPKPGTLSRKVHDEVGHETYKRYVQNEGRLAAIDKRQRELQAGANWDFVSGNSSSGRIKESQALSDEREQLMFHHEPVRQKIIDAHRKVTTSTNNKSLRPLETPNEIRKSLAFIEKAYSATRDAWIFKFANIMSRYMLHNMARSLAETQMLSALETEGRQAFMDGLAEGGVTEMDETDEAVLDKFLVDQIDFIDGLFNQVDAGSLTLSQVPMRASMWANKSLAPMLEAGRASANDNGYYEWVWNPEKDHCEDCQRLNGQVHRYREYRKRGWLPKSDKLACGGMQCGCSLKRVKGPGRGRF